MNDLPAMELSAEQLEKIKQNATEGFSHWRANATPEIKAAGEAQMQRFMTEPEFGASEIARVTADF